MKILCTLQYGEAVTLIEKLPQVYYKHGVWNEYKLRDTSAVIPLIMKSGYGADVREKNGELYVSVPADCDMW